MGNFQELDRYMSTGGKIKAGLIGIIVLHLLLLSKLVFFPYPELFIYPYLTNIGLLPYSQILDQHFPGLMFFPLNLGTLGMHDPSDARVVQYALVIAVHLLLFAVAKKLFKPQFVLVPSFLYFLWQPYFGGNVLWIDSLVSVLLLAGLFCLLNWDKKRTFTWLAISGLVFGLTITFKQVALPIVVLIGGVLYWKSRNLTTLVTFYAAAAIPVFFMLFYILSIGVLDSFFYWTYQFNVTTFAEMGRKYGSFNEITRASFVFGPALLIGFVLPLGRRMYISVLFFGSLLFVYARFDYEHLQPALPFAILLITYLTFLLPKKLVSSAAILYLIFASVLLSRFYATHWSGRVRFFGELERKLTVEVSGYAQEGDTIFALATTPHIYQLTKTRPPGDVFVFHFPWFMTIAEDTILEGIKSDPPKIVLRDPSATTGNDRLIDYMKAISSYIDENYEVVKKIDGVELLIPKHK